MVASPNVGCFLSLRFCLLLVFFWRGGGGGRGAVYNGFKILVRLELDF